MKDILFILLLFPLVTFSQAPDSCLVETEEFGNYDDVKEETADSLIYFPANLDRQATFPGGLDTLLYFIATNYVIHSTDAHDRTTGMIQIAFIIEKDGTVSNVKVIRGLTKTANAEAVRVIESMPKWKPAMLGELLVRMQFVIPIILSN